MQADRKRPTGVTIIAVLMIIGGILTLIGGIGLVIVGPLISQYTASETSSTFENNMYSNFNFNSTDISSTNNFLSIFSGYLSIIGAGLIALAIVHFIVAWGLLKGKGWAWSISVIIIIISLVVGIIFVVFNVMVGDISSIIGQIVGMVISGIILWYLYRSNVRKYFGKVKVQAS
ncbi:MAG TPA: DUF2127 domain-containing protein [Nitrososphaeraceae archaeon]